MQKLGKFWKFIIIMECKGTCKNISLNLQRTFAIKNQFLGLLTGCATIQLSFGKQFK